MDRGVSVTLGVRFESPFTSQVRMSPEKWGEFGNPERPAFWLTFLAANASCLVLIYFLLA